LEKEGRPEAADLDIDCGRSVMAIEQENVNLEVSNTRQKRKMSALGHFREMETLMVNFLCKFNETECSLQENQIKEIEDKLRLAKQILVGDNGINPVIVPSKEQVLTTRVISPDRNRRISRKDRTPISNPRYRRSQRADRWIDHRPQTLVPMGTVLQKRRIVTRLTSSKKITQDHGTDGGVEIKLYKDDILPTSGGGSQVVFNDMECLKPSSSKRRKH